MSIDRETGLITWLHASPSGESRYSVQVTDSLDRSASATWSITVLDPPAPEPDLEAAIEAIGRARQAIDEAESALVP